VNGPFNPCTSGKAFSSGQNTPSITISPVMEARKPTLPWMRGTQALHAFFQYKAADRPT